MPADIIGTNIIVEDADGRKHFQFQRGPIFAHILLADEINRATPKTQSALLEAMQESAVTVGGATRPLPAPFFVLATQNPIEMEGTYPLPEAQLDRFLFKLRVRYPQIEELNAIIDRTTQSRTATVNRVLGGPDVLCVPRADPRGPDRLARPRLRLGDRHGDASAVGAGAGRRAPLRALRREPARGPGAGPRRQGAARSPRGATTSASRTSRRWRCRPFAIA